MHTYHHTCPGYDPQQILHDGCVECETRGEDFTVWAAHADPERWERAWQRAYLWQTGDTPREALHLACAEIGILKTLWSFQVELERRGIPLGTPLSHLRS